MGLEKYLYSQSMDVYDSVKLTTLGGNYECDSGSDGYDEDSSDDELSCDSVSSIQLQIRTKSSKARWIEKFGMAEVLEKKGNMWIKTGIERTGKTYCSLEETLFLAEIGALSVLNDNGELLQLSDIYGKLAEDKNSYGCSWESFEVYRNLKFLGYIVGRHGVPWSLKNAKTKNDAGKGISDSDRMRDGGAADSVSVAEMFSNLLLTESRPIFDVYLPDCKFKKSSPGNPSFVLCLMSGQPPSRWEIEGLKARLIESPLRFCIVEHGQVSFLSFIKVDLPVLS